MSDEQRQQRQEQLRQELEDRREEAKGAGASTPGADIASTPVEQLTQLQQQQRQQAKQDQIANADIKADAESHAAEQEELDGGGASTPADDTASAGDDSGDAYRRQGLPSRVLVDREGAAYVHSGVDLQVFWGALEYELIFLRELRPKNTDRI